MIFPARNLHLFNRDFPWRTVSHNQMVLTKLGTCPDSQKKTGKLTVCELENGHHGYVTVYQAGYILFNPITNPIKPPFSYGFPMVFLWFTRNL